jgi:heme-degrading monooxygenase HmoA
MIIRIVKMTFRPEEVASFLERFEPRKDGIRHFEGCSYLQVLQDKNNPHIIFSHSYWTDEMALNNYRHSDFFRETWKFTKPKFAAPAEAWTLHNLHELK